MTHKISRRDFLKDSALAVGVLAAGSALPHTALAAPAEKAQVFFAADIGPESLLKLYDRIKGSLGGKVAVKLHTGEPNGPNILPREWVKQLLAAIPQSTVVECNVLYDSPRRTAEGHRKTLETNGWTVFTTVDIMDEEGDAVLPIKGGKHLKEIAVGKNLLNYDSMLVLTHFKGHAMGGFGGSLKNIAIGCASGKTGKNQIHQIAENGDWPGDQAFMERMVEGGKAVADHFGPRIAYINVMNRMSVSCDCEGVKAQPVTTPDVGILASTDLLAIDQAAVDLIYALPADQKKDMVERIESRGGLRQLTYMKELGMGRAEYELIRL